MLDTLLEASGDRHGVFVWNVMSLVAAGLGERARASARLSAGRTIVEAAKLASVLYACLWLTAGLVVLIEPARMASRKRGLVVRGRAADRRVGVVARTPAPRRRDGPRVHGGSGARRCAPARSLAPSVDRATDRAGIRVSDDGDRSDTRASEHTRRPRARRTRCCECVRRREYQRVRPAHRVGHRLDRRAGGISPSSRGWRSRSRASGRRSASS